MASQKLQDMIDLHILLLRIGVTWFIDPLESFP
jgi:hypothetical protein